MQRLNSSRLWRDILIALWLGFLAAYILIGVPYASYHGDETSHLYNSHDYATLFIRHDPQALLVSWPINTEREYLRIADSSLARYSMGLAWHLAGYSESDLPHANFNWYKDYFGNRADGLIPDQALMVVARLPSAIFLALSVVVMFVIGYRLGGLPMAFFVSGLYALNPIILLNGRRALQEGSLLFFGLLTILIGMTIGKRREDELRAPILLWAALIVAGALTLASKNNGFIYVAAAFLWVFVPELLHLRLRSFLETGVKLAISGVLVIGLFVVLSPGLWNEPLVHIKDAALVRLLAINDQIKDDPEAPTTLQRRVQDILTQPFTLPEAHYEANHTNTYDAQRELIAAYDTSPISGIHFGAALGVPLTLLAIFGVVANLVPRLRPYASKTYSLGLTLWLIINVTVLLELPLPWQRYFLALIPVMTIFVAVGLWALIAIVRSTATQFSRSRLSSAA